MPAVSSVVHLWQRLTPLALVDILVVALLLYQFFMIVRGRRAAHILLGLTLLFFLYAVASLTGLVLLRIVLESLVPYAPFGIIVLFQSELRSLLARLGRRRWWLASPGQSHEFFEQIMLAVQELMQQRTGALLILERDIGLRTVIESGVTLDAVVSRDLLLTIFKSGGALHDGAVILQSRRIAAAGCFLPLSTDPAAMGRFGTRHRAAIGVTEETDCLAIVVSEETGNLAVALYGNLESRCSLPRVREYLESHFVRRVTQPLTPATAVRTQGAGS